VTENASTGPLARGRSQKQAMSGGVQVTTRQVHKVLSDDEDTRAMVMARFKALGGSLDRWSGRDHQAMALAMTAAEDSLELVSRGRMTAQREALRTIRRRLEAA
jgi:hypothetical protein